MVKKKLKRRRIMKRVKPPTRLDIINVYALDGGVRKKIKLPSVFKEALRPDLIKKAVRVAQSNRRQPYGPNPMAGKRHSVEWWGKGRGVSRVPRLKTLQGRGAFAPGTVGGRRAHPPRVEKVWRLKMNDKERKLALISALGATADLKLVAARGHKLSKNLTLPVVVEDEFEELATTKEVIKSLQHLGVYEDVCRARDGKHLRASRGRMRGRRYRIPKSLLIVVSKFRGIERGARNLPGLDIITPSGLNTEQLAPGGTPGRLTLFTESALNIVGSR